MQLYKKDYSTYSDEELMRFYNEGDSKAFEEIYERYENFMVNFFYRKLWNDRIKSEDFAHDLFTKIIDKPESFDLSRSFKTWLFSVANNMCKNEYKRQEVRKNTAYDVPEGFEAKDGAMLADKVVDKGSFKVELGSELKKLNEKHREVFMLRHFEGLSLKEIADALEINTGTVKSRLHHATKVLANRLVVFRKTML